MSESHQTGLGQRQMAPWLNRSDDSLTIISGGQTGVDRAALDAARQLGLPHGGWCPRGRLAEDGQIAYKYPLLETDSPDYAVRTEWNVRDSDGTLILTRGELSGGTRLTAVLALRYGRLLLVVDLDSNEHDDQLAARVCRWLRTHKIRVLNVAGPRESTCPGIYARARRLLLAILAKIDNRERK